VISPTTHTALWTTTKVLSAVLIVGWCATFLRRFDPEFALVPAWVRFAGFFILAIGLFLIALCGILLSTCGFGEPDHKLFPKEFIAIGPFRYVRNPMSIGAILAMLGWSMVNRSTIMFLAWLILTVFLHLLVIYVEEPGLEKRFGASYRAYRSAVPRWLPRFTKPARHPAFKSGAPRLAFETWERC
jgi:protein-S-isoprenylcysteine O-methyltransferase Ste14